MFALPKVFGRNTIKVGKKSTCTTFFFNLGQWCILKGGGESNNPMFS